MDTDTVRKSFKRYVNLCKDKGIKTEDHDFNRISLSDMAYYTEFLFFDYLFIDDAEKEKVLMIYTQVIHLIDICKKSSKGWIY